MVLIAVCFGVSVCPAVSVYALTFSLALDADLHCYLHCYCICAVFYLFGSIRRFNGLRRDAVLPAGQAAASGAASVTMGGNIREMRERISTVKNTEKITEAMRLVSAAKVRRAQDAVLKTRPFSETLQKVLGGLIKRLKADAVELPLLAERTVNKVVLVVISGDRGLCGSYNNYIIKKTEARIKELKAEGLEVELVCVGTKANTYFRRRETPIRQFFNCPQAPSAENASSITDELLAEYLSGEVDRIELLYTRFVSLISCEASIRTLLPLSPSGLETEGDEIFQLTSVGGQFVVKSETVPVAEAEDFPSDMIFEQEPLQILNAILPLYLNGQLLRTLQESVASELASRMSAMSSASDNAKDLGKSLSKEMYVMALSLAWLSALVRVLLSICWMATAYLFALFMTTDLLMNLAARELCFVLAFLPGALLLQEPGAPSCHYTGPHGDYCRIFGLDCLLRHLCWSTGLVFSVHVHYGSLMRACYFLPSGTHRRFLLVADGLSQPSPSRVATRTVFYSTFLPCSNCRVEMFCLPNAWACESQSVVSVIWVLAEESAVRRPPLPSLFLLRHVLKCEMILISAHALFQKIPTIGKSNVIYNVLFAELFTQHSSWNEGGLDASHSTPLRPVPHLPRYRLRPLRQASLASDLFCLHLGRPSCSTCALWVP